MKQSPFEQELENEIYTDRLLLLLEQDDGFRQVILTKAQFKKVSDACLSYEGPRNAEGLQYVNVLLGEVVIPKESFEGMRDFEA